MTVEDPSTEILSLCRVLHALNCHWSNAYPDEQIKLHQQKIANGDFVNPKLSSKANRQLQDPLLIMTGHLPNWISQLAHACPFLFPFETRQMLFYVTSFDRDRAMQRLLDTTPDLNSVDTSERVTPRLTTYRNCACVCVFVCVCVL